MENRERRSRESGTDAERLQISGDAMTRRHRIHRYLDSRYVRKSAPVDNGPKTGQRHCIFLFEERQHMTLSQLQNDQPDLSPQQGDAQEVSKPDRTDLGRGTSRFQITEEYHGTDIQLEAVGGKTLGTSGALS